MAVATQQSVFEIFNFPIEFIYGLFLNRISREGKVLFFIIFIFLFTFHIQKENLSFSLIFYVYSRE